MQFKQNNKNSKLQLLLFLLAHLLSVLLSDFKYGVETLNNANPFHVIF